MPAARLPLLAARARHETVSALPLPCSELWALGVGGEGLVWGVGPVLSFLWVHVSYECLQYWILYVVLHRQTELEVP